MKSRHVAGTVTKKKKSEPLILFAFIFLFFLHYLMMRSRVGGGGLLSIWGFEKVVCNIREKDKESCHLSFFSSRFIFS